MSRKRRRAPETRRLILRAAWELIEERGVEARLSDIAEHAGVSRQAVYLHFGDRAGLLLALVQFMDETLGLEEMVAHVFAAPSGIEMLERTMDLYARMAPQIDRVALVLEQWQDRDEAVAAAWRNRMNNRQMIHRQIVQRLFDEGELAEVWTVNTAAELFYGITLPGPWRELTGELGWTPDDYRRSIGELLRRALLGSGSSSGG